MLLDRDPGKLDLGLDEAERAEIVGAFDRLNQLFGATLAVLAAAADHHGISDALHAVCDMATAVSAISTNRFIGRAIIAWLHALAHLGKNTNDTRSHGWRLAAGIPHIARVRQHRGVPSAGDVKPNPRKDRAATRKLKDLAATARKDD